MTGKTLAIANVVDSIPIVAKNAAVFLFGTNGLQLRPDRTHVIGFSHGAHVGGIIGENSVSLGTVDTNFS